MPSGNLVFKQFIFSKACKSKSGNSESSDGGESGSGSTALVAGSIEQPDMPAIVLTPQERQAICSYVDMMNDVGLQQGEELKPQVRVDLEISTV